MIIIRLWGIFLLTSRYDGYFLITADKQLFYQDANQSDAFIAEKVRYVSTKGRAQFGQTILIIKSHQYSYKVAQTI